MNELIGVSMTPEQGDCPECKGKRMYFPYLIKRDNEMEVKYECSFCGHGWHSKNSTKKS